MNIVEFRKALLVDFAAKIDLALATVCKKITVEAFNSLTNLTPVDTGRARASWALALGSPSAFLPPDVSPSEKRARARSRRAGGASPPVFEPAQLESGVLAAIDGTQPIFITSNVAYMEALENGHSAKAPAGMVRVTVANIEAGLERIVSQP